MSTSAFMSAHALAFNSKNNNHGLDHAHAHAHAHALSMIEMMMITGLIGLMASMLLPLLENSRNTAKYAVCTMNMKQIYNAVTGESAKEGQGQMPPDPFQWEVYAEALVDSDVMICPMEGDSHIKLDKEKYNFLPEPPESVDLNAIEDDNRLIVFREKAAMTLAQDVDVIYNTGRYGRGFHSGGTCTFDKNGTLKKGTILDSYYFSFDPVTTKNKGSAGEISFGGYDDLVMGMLADSQHLHDTDHLFGAEGTNYPNTNKHRGLSPCHYSSDSIELSETRLTIIHQFSHANLAGKDDFRVFTTPGSGSSYAMNVEVPNIPKRDYQIFMTDAATPWIDFRGGVDDGEFSFEDTLEPRHFGKINVMLTDGSVELMEIENLRPESALWRAD